MSYSELRGEQADWSPLIQERVVYLIAVFAEVRVLGNVGRGLNKFEAYGFTTFPAVGKKRVAEQEQRGPRLVRMANFIDARLFNDFPGQNGAVGLVKPGWTAVLLLHEAAELELLFLPFLSRFGPGKHHQAQKTGEKLASLS